MASTTSFEEASHCPKCDQTGSQRRVQDGKDKSKIHVMTCNNGRCSWFETDWIVQVLEDGTVPVRDSSVPKTFPSMKGMSQEKVIEGIVDDETR